MIAAQKQKFFDVMLPVGRAKVVKVLPSEAACPFCGKHMWFAYSLYLDSDKLYPASGTIVLVDVLPPHKNSSCKDIIQIDECVGCGAVCSI